MARFTRRAEATGKADTTEGIVMKRLAAALSLVLVLGLALPGCAADEGTEPSGSTTGRGSHLGRTDHHRFGPVPDRHPGAAR